MTTLDSSGLVEARQQLETDIASTAQELSAISLAVINAVNPRLDGTELGEDWPLTEPTTIERRLIEIATPTQAVGRTAISTEAEGYKVRPRMFIEHKYYDSGLREIYETESPRQALANDFVAWAHGMKQAGSPVLVILDAADSAKVRVGIYEDNERTRTFFDELTDGSLLDAEMIAEGSKPHPRLSTEVIANSSDFVGSSQ